VSRARPTRRLRAYHPRRHRLIALALGGALALPGCGPPKVPARQAAPPAATRAPGTRTAALEHGVHELVNRYREAHGLAPLALDPRISRQARAHSSAMAAGTTPLGHDGFDDRVKALSGVMACRRTAENVAFNRGHPDAAVEAVRGWLASRGHRKNIEGPYELTGVGVVTNAGGEVHFTQIFVGR